jgi:uncharacterized membrane protein SirB2
MKVILIYIFIATAIFGKKKSKEEEKAKGYFSFWRDFVYLYFY